MKALSTCKNGAVETQELRVFPEAGGWEHWAVITCRIVIRWPSGETLEVKDFYNRRKGPILRDYSYHLMDGNGDCIFRFDTHGELVVLGASCHVHVGREEEILEADDPRLQEFRLVEMDFLQAYTIVHKYLKGKKLPWEK